MKYYAIIAKGEQFNQIQDSFRTRQGAEKELENWKSEESDPDCFATTYELACGMNEIMNFVPQFSRKEIIENWFK